MVEPLVLNLASTIHSTSVAPRQEPRRARDISPVRHVAFRIDGRLPGGYRLRQPISVQAHMESDGSVVVAHDELLAYGVGHTIGEAAADFQGMLVDMFEELMADESRLSESLRSELAKLRSRLELC